MTTTTPRHRGTRRRAPRWLLVLLAVVLTFAGIGIAHAADVTSEPTDQANDNLILRGAVVRLGTSVYVHQNSAHGAIGVTGIRLVNNCDLQLDLETQPGEKVVAAIAEEDETISRLDVQAGISGGTGLINVYLYKNGTKICANNAMFGTLSNLWIHLTYFRVPA